MDSATVLDLSQASVYLLLKLSLPVLLVALVVGLVVSLFQALTQIQEQTLTFIPKMIAVFVTILFTLSYIGSNMMAFSERIMDAIINIQ